LHQLAATAKNYLEFCEFRLAGQEAPMRIALITALITLLFAADVVSAAETDIGAQAQFCVQCHGPDGVSRWPDVPNISGLPEVVIANARYDYRGHARPCRKAACASNGACPDLSMCGIAEDMSDAVMDGYAVYYSSRPFGPAANDFDPAMAAVGRQVHDDKCEICHTQGGTDPADEASILRGQNRDYIANAMGDYRNGDRLGEDAMIRAIMALTDEQSAALIEFYASPVD
jgi:sulfide dehydrogenase cytochrome subunit